jgi:peptide deformylase
MAEMEIKIYGDPVLRQRAREVQEITPEITSLIEKMRETMAQAPGIGLAAPQVGESVRVILVTFGLSEDKPDVRALINPEIIWHSDDSDVCEEGCLSVPETTAKIKRWTEVKIRALDENGNTMELHVDGFTPRIIQHEIDHLDGILFIDRVSSLKQDIIKRKLKKFLEKEKG